MAETCFLWVFDLLPVGKLNCKNFNMELIFADWSHVYIYNTNKIFAHIIYALSLLTSSWKTGAFHWLFLWVSQGGQFLLLNFQAARHSKLEFGRTTCPCIRKSLWLETASPQVVSVFGLSSRTTASSQSEATIITVARSDVIFSFVSARNKMEGKALDLSVWWKTLRFSLWLTVKKLVQGSKDLCNAFENLPVQALLPWLYHHSVTEMQREPCWVLKRLIELWESLLGHYQQ